MAKEKWDSEILTQLLTYFQLSLVGSTRQRGPANSRRKERFSDVFDEVAISIMDFDKILNHQKKLQTLCNKIQQKNGVKTVGVLRACNQSQVVQSLHYFIIYIELIIYRTIIYSIEQINIYNYVFKESYRIRVFIINALYCRCREDIIGMDYTSKRILQIFHESFNKVHKI